MYEHVTVNNTFAQLSAGINTVAVTLNFTAGHGLRLPQIIAPQFLFATLVRASTGELERVKITAHASGADSATVVRGADSTLPLTFLAGDKLECRIGDSDLDQLPRLGLTETSVVAGGTADAITGALAASALPSLPDSFIVFVVGATGNQVNNPTFNLTLGVTPTGALPIVKGNQQPLAGGDIPPMAILMYRTAWNKWLLCNPFFVSLQSGDYVDSANPSTVRGGFLLPDGAAVSRTTNAALLEALVLRSVFTVTIASPGVVTWNAHGIPENGPVTLATTGALPSGLATATVYYAKSTTTNTFQLAATPGGAAINTSGGQSGVHTATYYPHGAGDGVATFNVPNLLGRGRISQGSGAITVAVDVAQVSTVNDDFTIPTNTDAWITGMKGQLTTTGALPTGLATLTDYWLFRNGPTSIKFASSLANAVAGTVIDITAVGSGVHTFTSSLKARTTAQRGGQEDHAPVIAELPSHDHPGLYVTSVGGGGINRAVGNPAGTATVSSVGVAQGGSTAANITGSYGVATVFIKT